MKTWYKINFPTKLGAAMKILSGLHRHPRPLRQLG